MVNQIMEDFLFSVLDQEIFGAGRILKPCLSCLIPVEKSLASMGCDPATPMLKVIIVQSQSLHVWNLGYFFLVNF